MVERLKLLNQSVIWWKLIAAVGLTQMVSICLWVYVHVRFRPDFKTGAVFLATASLIPTAAVIFIFVRRFIRKPVEKLIEGTMNIAGGNYTARIELNQSDELATLARAINDMGKAIGEKEAALHNQRDEYRRLYEMMPCIISVQDREYRLVSYNSQFKENFSSKTR